ncbi:MAG: acyltransferase [Acidocella sp.]|nr:acyltransferase [Acidocella sp.]
MKRQSRLDGLRGVLAVYVMLGHALPFTDIPGWVSGLFSHGEAAVDLFFCLSGMVISASVARFQGRFAPFIVARASRLLPTYFVALCLAMLLLMCGDPLPTLRWASPTARYIMESGLPQAVFWHICAHLVLAQGIIPQGALPFAYVTLLGPAWSLSTEWQFYVLIGLVAPRRLGVAALGLTALALAYHAITLPPWWQFSRAFLPDAAADFGLGMASAALFRGHGRVIFATCLLGGLLDAMVSANPDKMLIPLIWCAILFAQMHKSGALLDHKVLQYLGAISYPLYLINEPVQRGLALLIAPLSRGATGFTLFWLPASVGLSLIAAAALHHGVERRFMKKGQKNTVPVIAATASQ